MHIYLLIVRYTISYTQCLSTERCEVTGESSKHTGKVQQQEVAEEPPQDHESGQEESEDEENSLEAS